MGKRNFIEVSNKGLLGRRLGKSQVAFATAVTACAPKNQKSEFSQICRIDGRKLTDHRRLQYNTEIT